jgi:hypothetical protein
LIGQGLLRRRQRSAPFSGVKEPSRAFRKSKTCGPLTRRANYF